MPERGRATYGNPSGHTGDIDVVRAIYDAFARRDLEAALELVAGDVEVIIPGTAAAAGRKSPYRGHEGIRQYFADAAAVWDDLRVEAEDVRATGGSVVVFGQVTGRAGDRILQRRVVWTWRVRDGKAVSLRVNDVGEARAAC
jgi:ketosteroid isomerase-like protein